MSAEIERAAHNATVALAEFDRAGVMTVLQTVPALAQTLRELLAAVTALSSPPADDAQCGFAPGDALRCIQPAGHGGIGHMVSDIATADAARELISPPADDVREEAERRWPVMVTGYTDSDGSRFECEGTENRQFREAFIAGAAFEVRRAGLGDMPNPRQVRRLIAELSAAGYEVRPYGTVTDTEALAKAWDEGVRTAGAYGHEDTWTHDMTPYSQNPYRGEARS